MGLKCGKDQGQKKATSSRLTIATDTPVPTTVSKGSASIDETLKILTVGDSGVGKTSLLLRFTEGTFSENIFETISMDYKSKTLTIDHKNIELQIWDTAGQERFKTITQSYYRGASGVFVCFSIDNEDSFKNLRQWIQDVDRHAPEGIVKVLVGTKADLESERQVSIERAQKFAVEHDIQYFETSSKTNLYVERAFTFIGKEAKSR
eukprot:TRINITY_DN1080_c0_g1_i1.p1 TRINITY_DN1080_c0_g1~~TRINITY_DN1080_c0_g1_i1.p1  ORF type:complete len:206 (+),score=28.99 TRINITY_DN1080_c0_g1_i1:95-712(+)